jgi:hypothetical protein
MIINMQCENKSSNVEEEKLWSLPGTFKWSDQNEDLYIDSLIEPDNSYLVPWPIYFLGSALPFLVIDNH